MRVSAVIWRALVGAVAGVVLAASPAWALTLYDTGDDTGVVLTPTDPTDTGGSGTATAGSSGGRLDADTLHGLSAAEWAGDTGGGGGCAVLGAAGGGAWALALIAVARRRRDQPSSSSR